MVRRSGRPVIRVAGDRAQNGDAGVAKRSRSLLLRPVGAAPPNVPNACANRVEETAAIELNRVHLVCLPLTSISGRATVRLE